MNIKVIGFHGTGSVNEKHILAQGFNESRGDHHWLGDGVYFFVEGNSAASPMGAAVKWAIAQAYDETLGRNKYQEYVVIEAVIKVAEENFLDLNTEDGMKVFNRIRNGFMDKVHRSGYRLKSKGFQDGHLINLARSQMKLPIHAVKGDFYIKFQVERIEKLNFRIPNCTILSVVRPDDHVNLESLRVRIKRKF